MKAKLFMAFAAGLILGAVIMNRAQHRYYARLIEKDQRLWSELIGYSHGLEATINRLVGTTNSDKWLFERKKWP